MFISLFSVHVLFLFQLCHVTKLTIVVVTHSVCMILMPYHIDVVVLLAMRVMDTDVNPEVIYLISFLSLSLK